MLALSLSPGVKSSKITALAVEERPPSLVLKVKGLTTGERNEVSAQTIRNS